MPNDLNQALVKAKLQGASDEELYWIEETFGRSCKTCDHWNPITESTGRCQYFYHRYLEDPQYYNFEEPKEQPITSNAGLCEVFSGYREGELKKNDTPLVQLEFTF